MRDRVWDRPIVRILLVVLGFAGILLCPVLLFVASFGDGPTNVVMIAIALGFLIGGVLLIRSAVA